MKWCKNCGAEVKDWKEAGQMYEDIFCSFACFIAFEYPAIDDTNRDD